jgi:hypothetical protein
MKRLAFLWFKCCLSSCLLTLAVASSAERAEASNLQAVVDDFSDLMYFRFHTTEPFTSQPNSTILFQSTGFVSGNQMLLPGNMMWLGGTPNDDGSDGPSFIEIDSTNNAVAIALSFDFPNGGITGVMEGNPAVKFDYSQYTPEEQETLEMIAKLGAILSHQGTGGEDIHLTVIPEPVAWSLLALGVVAVIAFSRRRPAG